MAVPHSDSQAALFGRVFWMMLGPAFLLISATIIVNSPAAGWHTAADIVYWVTLAGMILARGLEYRSGNPRNALGEPARPGEWSRFVIVVFAVGAAVWIAANLVGNYLLR